MTRARQPSTPPLPKATAKASIPAAKHARKPSTPPLASRKLLQPAPADRDEEEATPPPLPPSPPARVPTRPAAKALSTQPTAAAVTAPAAAPAPAAVRVTGGGAAPRPATAAPAFAPAPIKAGAARGPAAARMKARLKVQCGGALAALISRSADARACACPLPQANDKKVERMAAVDDSGVAAAAPPRKGPVVTEDMIKVGGGAHSVR